MQGSDLMQVASAAEETLILSTLGSKIAYAQPIMPGIYHLGLYQRQSGRKFYHGNGVSV